LIAYQYHIDRIIVNHIC